MAQFLLIHGSWQGAWCWREIIQLLHALGHQAKAIDLPGHGNDSSRSHSVTLEDYVDAIASTLESFDEPSILVGHSMTGQVTLAAERVPDKIRALVYVAGILTHNGSSMMSAVEGFDPEYVAQIEWAPDRRTARIQSDGAQKFLYPLCPTEIARDAISRLTPQAVAPFESAILTTAENYGRLQRYYVECLQDRAIPIALQRSMQSAHTWKRVYSLDTDHSPFFSSPEKLASILHETSIL